MSVLDIFRRRRPESGPAPIQISAGAQIIADAEEEEEDIGRPMTEDQREEQWQRYLATLTPAEKLEACKSRARGEAERERYLSRRAERKAIRDGNR